MSGMSVALAMLLQASATPAAVPASTGAETPVCRRVEVTGSLARKERVCKTKAEWRAVDEDGNSRARAIVDYSTGRPSGQ